MIDGWIILAASDDSSIARIILGLVFVFIWIVSAALTQIAKKKEQERRRRVRESLAGHAPVSAPPVPAHKQQKPQTTLKSPRKVSTRPPVITPAIGPAAQRPTTSRLAAPALATQPVQTPAAHVSHPVERRPVASATAIALHAWLRPATLRQQFILTEILQPPLALRDEQI